jgi:hypothetical protein
MRSGNESGSVTTEASYNRGRHRDNSTVIRSGKESGSVTTEASYNRGRHRDNSTVMRSGIESGTVTTEASYNRGWLCVHCLFCFCRKWHNEGIHDLYCSPTQRRMRWAGHVAHVGENWNAYRALVGKPEGKRHLEDLDVDGSIILKWNWKEIGWEDLDGISLV